MRYLRLPDNFGASHTARSFGVLGIKKKNSQSARNFDVIRSQKKNQRVYNSGHRKKTSNSDVLRNAVCV